MSATRNSLLADLNNRLGTTTPWTEGERFAFIDHAIEGLYPSFYRFKTQTTVADDGPLQTLPAGARNLHFVGLQRTGSTRVRKLRGWSEGDGNAYIPKTGISGETLVWAWTEGWSAPTNSDEVIGIPKEAREVVVLRAHISALEHLLTDRMARERYLSINAREMVSDEDIAATIDILHLSLRERLERVRPLPEVNQ
jgi:hypothetical protein